MMPRKSPFQDGECGVFDRNIRAGAIAMPIGRSQRRSIIDAVSCHGDDPCPVFAVSGRFRLSPRENFRFNLIKCREFEQWWKATSRRSPVAITMRIPSPGKLSMASCAEFLMVRRNKGAHPLPV